MKFANKKSCQKPKIDVARLRSNKIITNSTVPFPKESCYYRKLGPLPNSVKLRNVSHNYKQISPNHSKFKLTPEF